MAAHDVDLVFGNMTELELRQWVNANPGRVNDRDLRKKTPLFRAIDLNSVPLILWSVKEKGADLNAVDRHKHTVLYVVGSLEVFNALLECGADPGLPDASNYTLLIMQFYYSRWDIVTQLLQDPRVHTTIVVQDLHQGYTVL